MSHRIDLSGQRFGRLVAVREDGVTAKSQLRWACRCDCGSMKTIASVHLRRGAVVSCGCYKRENASARMRKHSMSKTRVYHAWKNMLFPDGIAKLDQAIAYFGLTMPAGQRHTALADALATAELYSHLLGLLRQGAT